MKLKDFIKDFVRHNTLIRLWYPVGDSQYEEVIPGDKPKMEHQLTNSIYSDNQVLGVTDILYLDSRYMEAVNIVIEK